MKTKLTLVRKNIKELRVIEKKSTLIGGTH